MPRNLALSMTIMWNMNLIYIREFCLADIAFLARNACQDHRHSDHMGVGSVRNTQLVRQNASWEDTKNIKVRLDARFTSRVKMETNWIWARCMHYSKHGKSYIPALTLIRSLHASDIVYPQSSINCFIFCVAWLAPSPFQLEELTFLTELTLQFTARWMLPNMCCAWSFVKHNYMPSSKYLAGLHLHSRYSQISEHE